MALVADLVREIIDADEAARIYNMRRAWDTYYGRMDLPLASAKDGTSDNVILPMGRVLVDASRSFLVGKEPAFTVSDDFPGKTDQAQTYLDAVWKANRKATLLQNIVLNGSVAGHTFVKLVERIGQPPKIVNLDPANVRVVWDPDDFGEVLAYVITWTVEIHNTDGTTSVEGRRQRIERSERGDSWLIIDERSREDSPIWQEVARATWTRPWPPIVDCQNLPAPNEFYGVSDLEPDVIAMIDRANFIMSNTNRVLRYHGHPKVFITGANKPSDLQVAPDEATYIPLGANVFQLVPELDLAQALAAYDKVMDVLFQVSRVPRVALGEIEGSANVPGISLIISYRPLMEKTEDKRRLYGDLLSELNRRILSLGTFGEEGFVEPTWQDPVPRDALAEAQTALAKQQAGVSKATTLEELGYDPDEEKDARADDTAEAADALLQTQSAVGVGTEEA